MLPVIGPAEMAAEIHAAQGRSAILFGPERSGLATEDVALASKIVTVPINPEFGSLNLAQCFHDGLEDVHEHGRVTVRDSVLSVRQDPSAVLRPQC